MKKFGDSFYKGENAGGLINVRDLTRPGAVPAHFRRAAPLRAAENDSIDKLRRDAEQGDTETQFSLGRMYAEQDTPGHNSTSALRTTSAMAFPRITLKP